MSSSEPTRSPYAPYVPHDRHDDRGARHDDRGPQPVDPAVSLAKIAVMTALMAVLGAMPGIPVPLVPAPITLQTLAVMLAGIVLGPWRGAASMLLFNALVALGLPLLAGGRGGLGAFAGPSVGFILGWILATLVVGLVFRAMTGRLRPGISAGRVFTAAFVASVVGAIVVLYACGIPGMALVAGLPLDKAALGSAAFLPGDLVKAVVASLLAAGLWKAYPRAFR